MSSSKKESDRLEVIEEKLRNLDKVSDKMIAFMTFMMEGEGQVTEDPAPGPSQDNSVPVDHVADAPSVLSNNDSDDDSAGSVISTHALNSNSNEAINSPSVNSSNAFADRMCRYEKKDQCAPPINEELAAFVNKTITSHVIPEEFKKLCESHKVPENTPMLVVPRLNKEVWDFLPDAVRQKDQRTQGIQKNIVQGLYPLVLAMDKCEDPVVLELLKDSFEILAHASMDTNVRRRNELKPDMRNAKHLTNKDVPVTSLLFGDDLDTAVKKIEQTNKLKEHMTGPSTSKKPAVASKPHARHQFTHKFTPSFNNNKFHPYPRNDRFQHFQSKAKAFLGNGPFKSRGRTQTKGKFRGKK